MKLLISPRQVPVMFECPERQTQTGPELGHDSLKVEREQDWEDEVMHEPEKN